MSVINKQCGFFLPHRRPCRITPSDGTHTPTHFLEGHDTAGECSSLSVDPYYKILMSVYKDFFNALRMKKHIRSHSVMN